MQSDVGIRDEFVIVDEHAYKHGLTEGQIPEAWGNFVERQPRETPNEDQVVSVGFASGVPREIQMAAVTKILDNERFFIIYHARSPAQKSVLNELGIPGAGRQ